jgi:asparagine synthase (glutamine-hydrolysing)
MCGIGGIMVVGGSKDCVNRSELSAMSESMARRGPDGQGTWISADQGVGLIHRRLAIIDLSEASAQPFVSKSGSLVAVFNGEIYNYKELRAELVAKGHTFISDGDTEVVLKLYEEKGPAMIRHLRGMFSIVIWDARAQELFLARDPFGIKPLYYSLEGSVFRFASQVKAIAPWVPSKASPAGHVGFFLWGFVPEPYSLYESIRSVPAGTTMTVRRTGHVSNNSYFSIREEFESANTSPLVSRTQALDGLREAVTDTVRAHFVSDVPVGMFLSAGVDSTVIAAVSKKIGASPLHAVTISFEEFRGTHFDEASEAASFAADAGITHEIEALCEKDFETVLPELLAAMDQPSVDGVNSFLVSRAAKRRGMKVALSGLGGDEVFAGYAAFRQIPAAVRTISKIPYHNSVGRLARRLLAKASPRILPAKHASLLEYGGSFEGAYLLRRALQTPWEVERLLEPGFAAEGLTELDTMGVLRKMVPAQCDNTQKVSALELGWYMRSQLLRDTDWAGMAHSLEIRTPFVDPVFFKKVLSLRYSRSHGCTKRDLVEACLQDSGKRILARKKTGFATPVSRWLKTVQPVQTRWPERGLRGWAQFVYERQWLPGRTGAADRVIVFRIGQLGDSLVAIPAIQRIRQRHPNAHIALLTNRSAAGLVSAWEVFRPLRTFDSVFFHPAGHRGIRFLRATLSLTLSLARYRATHVYYLTPPRSRWQRARDRLFFKVLIGAQQLIVGQPIPISSSGSSPRIPEWKRLRQIVDPMSGSDVPLSLPSEAISEASSVFPMSGHWIAIAPGSKMPSKIWPLERFRAVGDELLARFPDVKIVILGGNADREASQALATSWGDRSIDLAGKLSIYGSAAVLKACALYIGNDTGTMHLAAAAGVRCVAIFSARDTPGKWDPIGTGHVVLRREVPCGGCMLELCQEHKNECLTKIVVDDVVAAAVSILSEQDNAPAAKEARVS